MTKKQSDDPSKAEWVDPDDAPELTSAWFRTADLYHGEKLIHRGERPLGKAAPKGVPPDSKKS